MLLPIVTPELLAKLRETFPSRPTRQMGLREIDHQIGHQEVIDYLQHLLDNDSSDPLGGL